VSLRAARDRGGVISNANDLRILEPDELVTKLREAKEELFKLRFQYASGQLENHGRLNSIRKDIARIYTVMREIELGITIKHDEGAA